MHWCYQESEALIFSIPFVGFYARKAYAWYHGLIHGKHNHDICTHQHIAAGNTDPHFRQWDWIDIEDVEERFGKDVVDDLIGNFALLNMSDAPNDKDFCFMVNQQGGLRGIFHGRLFVYDRAWTAVED